MYTGYGVGDHIEQLPIVLRSLDNTFLQNDFFINANINSIARLHYADTLTLLAGSKNNLPLVFLILTLSANILISIITFYLTRHLFNKSNSAGIYASALVMTMSTFSLGWSHTIYTSSLVPSTIAIPLVLGAISIVIIYKKLIMGILLSGIASIIHPLFGLETGGILLLAFVAFYLFNEKKITADKWKIIISSSLILILFSLFSIIPQFSQPRIDSNLFIYIIAFFRHPHHYVPSTFGLFQYIYAFSFFSASFLMYYHWRQAYEQSSNFILILMGIILLFCGGGYIFVEILPSQIWTIAQTFRLLYIGKWFGLIFLGGTIGVLVSNIKSQEKALYLASVFSPLTLGVTVLSQTCKDVMEKSLNKFSIFFEPFLIILVNIAILLYRPPNWKVLVLFTVYVLSILIFNTFRTKFLYLIILICISLASFLYIFRSSLPIPARVNTEIHKIENNLALGITKSELGSDGAEIAEFAQHHTPQDAIFFTPPNWGQFRLLAKRAIVVDFKAFPFADVAIAEWYERINNCYDNPVGTGFLIIGNSTENYKNITDSKLLELSRKYNFTYAVLYSETPTNFNELFQSDKYKIVKLP